MTDTSFSAILSEMETSLSKLTEKIKKIPFKIEDSLKNDILVSSYADLLRKAALRNASGLFVSLQEETIGNSQGPIRQMTAGFKARTESNNIIFTLRFGELGILPEDIDNNQLDNIKAGCLGGTIAFIRRAEIKTPIRISVFNLKGILMSPDFVREELRGIPPFPIPTIK